MAVSSESNKGRQEFPTNGTTTFSYTEGVDDPSRLTVNYYAPGSAPVTLTYTSGTAGAGEFSFSGTANANGDYPSGGTVTTGDTYTSGKYIIITRDTSQTSGSNYSTANGFPAATFQRDIDRLTLMSQDLQEQLDRCLKVSQADVGSYSLDFQVDEASANGYVKLNNGKTGFELAAITSDEVIEDTVGGMVTGNTETGISVTYEDSDGTLDFVVSDTTVAGDSGSTAITPGDTLTIAGGTDIATAMSGDTLTINYTGAGSGVSELSDLSDVATSTPTNGFALVADGTDFHARALVEADISDLGTYLTTASTPTLSGSWDFANDLAADIITESTSAAGVTVDSVVLKDAGITATGTIDFGAATSVEIPNGATPTVNAAGEIAVDTTIADHTGLITYHDGTEALYAVALPTSNLTSNDGYIISYNATNNEFVMAAPAAGNAASSQAQMETATDTTTFVSPGRQQYHPSSAKAWVSFTGTGTVTINQDYGVSSITDNGTGDYTVNFDTAFSAATYCATGAVGRTGASAVTWFPKPSGTFTTSAFQFLTLTTAGATADSSYVTATFYGDQ